jgi:hypothetical protein
MLDYVRELEMPEDQRGECVDTFVLNATFLRLLRTISGSQRLVPVEQVIEEGTQAGSPGASREPTSDSTLPAGHGFSLPLRATAPSRAKPHLGRFIGSLDASVQPRPSNWSS